MGIVYLSVLSDIGGNCESESRSWVEGATQLDVQAQYQAVSFLKKINAQTKPIKMK